MREHWRDAAVIGALLLLAALLWQLPPAGDDAYHHALAAVEQVRAWSQGSWLPRFQPDWNAGTGSFFPTAFAPLAICLDGALTAVVGEGTRALGLALVLGLALGWLAFRGFGRGEERGLAWLWPVSAYPLGAALARATVTEVWALAGAAGIILLALPPGPRSRREAAGLAVLVALVSGFEVSMLVLLAWLLTMAWLAAGLSRRLGRALRAAGWMALGLTMGAFWWLPLVMDVDLFARHELVEGPLDWRHAFVLPPSDNGALGPLLVAVSLSLLVVVALFVSPGRLEGTRSRALAAAIGGAVVLAMPVAKPLWHLPGMDGLQFPWRFLGPATVAAVALASTLGGWRRTVAVGGLILPCAFIPIRLDNGRPPLVPSASGRELALRAHVRYQVTPTLPTYAGNHSVGFDRVESIVALEKQSASVRVTSARDGVRELSVTVGDGGTDVLLPVQWWPEWKVSVDGAPSPYRNVRGLVGLTLRPGRHRIRVVLAPSRSQRTGAFVSLLGLVALVGCLWLAGGTKVTPGEPRRERS